METHVTFLISEEMELLDYYPKSKKTFPSDSFHCLTEKVTGLDILFLLRVFQELSLAMYVSGTKAVDLREFLC